MILQEQALPQIFHNPDGSAAAMNQDGTLNSPTNRAKVGSLLTIWATGTANLAITAGQIAPTASNSCSSRFQINIYGASPAQQATVLYAGSSPGYASGFTEIVFRIPSVVNSVTLSVNGFPSDPVTLYTSP